MSQIFVTAIVIAVSSLLLVKAAIKGVNQPLRIVNSTNVRELKVTFPPDNKSKPVAYVYPENVTNYRIGDSHPVMKNMTSHRMGDSHPVMKNASTTGKIPDGDSGKPEKKCYNRVLEDHYIKNYTITVYTDSREDLEAAGKTVYDTICEGDADWDKISAGALASLCCG